MKAAGILLVILLATGCAPTPAEVTATAAMAEAQTQTAAPTFAPTVTPTVPPTATPTPTVTPTPLTSKGGLPGESIADSVLQRDVLGLLDLFYSPAYECDKAVVTNTFLAEPLSDGKWAERWLIDFCGTPKSYVIGMIPDPNGGTTFQISPE